MNDLNDDSAPVGELDVNFEVDKEEKFQVFVEDNLERSDDLSVDLNQHEKLGSPSLPADFKYEISESSHEKSNHVPDEFDDDNVRNTKFYNDHESVLKNNCYQGEVDDLHGSNFLESSSQFKEQILHSEKGTEDSARSQESPFMADANHGEQMESDSDLVRPSVYSEIEGEATDNHIGKLSSPRKMLVSPESSPYTHHSPNDHKPLSSKQGFQDPSYSPRSVRQNHSSSPERYGLGKGVSPRHHLSPARKTSVSPPKFRQRSKHKDDSSQKRISALPKTSNSPPNYRRRDRSVSRSPIQRRDSSFGKKRGYRDRSRSRSPPYARARYRSPRRRYSPRRRSPPSGYHSRHRSPRRPWSPPPNRSTGMGKPGRDLFVAGFSFLTTERDLERKFSRFGRVRDVRIVRDKRSGDSRGFGFLSMERDDDADAAIRALDETEWNGRIILVEKSKSSGP